MRQIFNLRLESVPEHSAAVRRSLASHGKDRLHAKIACKTPGNILGRYLLQAQNIGCQPPV